MESAEQNLTIADMGSVSEERPAFEGGSLVRAVYAKDPVAPFQWLLVLYEFMLPHSTRSLHMIWHPIGIHLNLQLNNIAEATKLEHDGPPTPKMRIEGETAWIIFSAGVPTCGS